MVTPTHDELDTALSSVRSALAADDIELHVGSLDDQHHLRLALVVQDSACEDCFVPIDVMEQIAEEALRAQGIQVAGVRIEVENQTN